LLKLLLIVFLGYIVYRLVRSYAKSLSGQGDPTKLDSEGDMVRCSVCGIHFPKSEGFLAAGKYYCSEEHRKTG
jgi:uncharacterized protein